MPCRRRGILPNTLRGGSTRSWSPNSQHPEPPSLNRSAKAENLKGCSVGSGTQWRSNPVSGRSLPKTGIFQMSAGDYRLSRPENGENRSLETSGQVAKARHWRAFVRVSGIFSLRAGLVGWRRSADRARLQANSLLTGNFTGNFAIQGFESRFCRQEVPVLQRFFASSLRKLTGKIFRGTGKLWRTTGNSLTELPHELIASGFAAAVTITHRPCSTDFSRYPLSDPSRERRMCALRAPAASVPATAQPLSFPAHRRDPAPIAFPSSGDRIRSPLIVPARALDGKSPERCPW